MIARGDGCSHTYNHTSTMNTGTPADIESMERYIEHGEDVRVHSELLSRARAVLARWRATQDLLEQIAKVG